VLRAEDNEILTRVGPGTPMGALLRRYWTPACLTAEIPEPGGAPLRVRLLGENLVAFRDTRGRVGLLQENCPHRGASLYFGRNEDAAIRCVYHGWAFDVEGKCVDMPSEPAPFCEKVRMRAYPVHESGGIVWAYLGPRETMTPFRDFGTDGAGASEFIAAKQHSTCNWVQAMEGNLDTSHISHLHQFDAIDDIPDDGSDKPGYPSNWMSWKFWRHDRAPRLEVDDTWYGYRYAGIRTTPNGNTHVRITAYALPYSTFVASIPFSSGQGMFVPIDDENCWRYIMMPRTRRNPRDLGGANLFAVPGAPFTVPTQRGAGGIVAREYTAENDYQISREAQRYGIFSGVSDFVSQDLMVTESMGPIYDRSQEQLGSTDRAISRMRHLLISAAKGLAEGKEPPALTGDFAAIRGAEKILEPDEDWRLLGTDEDPVVQEAYEL
jgi:phenylpropionate dioxygenase-like ring-hydroxylating dioxygenase large terminal subunit